MENASKDTGTSRRKDLIPCISDFTGMAMMTMKEADKERNIVYICDENYLIPTRVSIRSLLDNLYITEEYKYLIHICTFAGETEDWQKLFDIGDNKVKIRIHHLDFQKYKEKYDRITQKTYVTTTAMLKFELPYILSDIDEALYLDSDTIIKQSLDQIFEYDISQNALAAVFDIVFDRALRRDAEHSGKSGSFYFNSGVMLLNLKEFRARNISEALWQAKFSLTDSPDDVMNLMDQNAFNSVLAGDCIPLPIRFNCSNQYPANAKFDIGEINRIYGTDYRDTIDLWKDAVIIHYIGRTSKPWAYADCACREVWDHYAKLEGIDIADLSRTTDKNFEKKGFGHYIGKGLNLVKNKGIKYTERYIRYKLMLKMAGK